MATQTVQCKADTYVSFASPSGNFSSLNSMLVHRILTSSSAMMAFLQFDIPLLVNKQITKVELKIHCTQKGRRSTIVAAQYAIPVSVNTLTGNIVQSQYIDSDMAYSPTEITSPAYVSDANEWIIWDITSIVTNALGTNNAVIGLQDLTGAQSDDTEIWKFSSRESTNIPYIDITYNDAVPDLPTIIYPNGDVIEKGNALTFQWKHNSLYDTGQTKYDFGWRQQGNASWTDALGVVSTVQSRTLDTSSMPTGIIEWRVRTYNAINAVSEYAYGAFELTGRPTAPIIDSMKNDAITEITWRSNEAETAIFRLWIYQGATLIHDSGERPGGFTSSYIPNMMFPDGTYTVKMRIGSVYGVWSDEAARVFTISTPQMAKPGFSLSSAKTGIRITAETINNYLRYVRYSPNANGSNMTETRQPNSQYVGVGYMPMEVYEHENLILNSTGNLGNISKWNGLNTSNMTLSVVDGPALELADIRVNPTSRVNVNQNLAVNKRSGSVTIKFTYKATSTSITSSSGIGVMLRADTVENPYLDIIPVTNGQIIADNQWHTKSITGNLSILEGKTINKVFILLFTYGGTITYKDLKLEYGEVSTPWTPAPSDWLSDPTNYAWIPIQSYDNVNAAERIVYRSENGINFEPIARFTGESYIDYAVKSGVMYEYFIRAHNMGFSDSDKLTMKVNYKGVNISNVNTPDDYIQAYQSDSDWYNVFKTTPINEAELITYEGREYPVKEAGIHREYKINTSFYLNNRDTKRLRDMHKANGIYLFRSAEECFCCEIEINDENTFLNKGKKVEVTLTRLDYDMGVRFDV
ncbi:DNRLRE domain-containing protein [Lacrimispora sp.]|uniref:DNRLRE domain-containing protein n=1 Tax=Lacrimispora sp. TaxID=2719234 RepID=UPI00285EB6C0|nr:DNRLRE domain-containing protein [Lacrimispora sp.]MDR7814540.1 DNRLRE domain-containing protein [Lacrimispora sp.]